MDIEQIQCFKLIAEKESLSKAAKIMYSSQNAMSKTLSRFEEEVGTKLFDRGPNKLTLNGAGEITLRYVNQILDNVDQMKRELNEYIDKTNSLHIGFCDPGIMWYCLPKWLYNNSIKIEGELYDREEEINLLKYKKYDILITPYALKDEKIASEPYIEDTVCLSVAKGSSIYNRTSLAVKEIPPQPLIYPNIGGFFEYKIEETLQRENPSITLIKYDYIITQQLIHITDLLTTSSTIASLRRDDGNNRKLIPLTDECLQVMYHICYLKSEKQRVKDFIVNVEQIVK